MLTTKEATLNRSQRDEAAPIEERPLANALRHAVDAWNRGDLTAYLDVYHPSVVLHGAPPGRDGVRLTYERIWRLFPGSTLELDDLIVEGDRLACRYTWAG
jgi:predicted ester cyclase